MGLDEVAAALVDVLVVDLIVNILLVAHLAVLLVHLARVTATVAQGILQLLTLLVVGQYIDVLFFIHAIGTVAAILVLAIFEGLLLVD